MLFEIESLVGKTIQSVHKNRGYILKFTDGSTLNMMACVENDIPIIRFHPPVNKESIVNHDIESIPIFTIRNNNDRLVRRINGIPTKEDLL